MLVKQAPSSPLQTLDFTRCVNKTHSRRINGTRGSPGDRLTCQALGMAGGGWGEAILLVHTLCYGNRVNA